MATQQRKQATLLLTLRVLRFVNQLRHRVEPRVFEGSIDTLILGTQDRRCAAQDGMARIRMRKAKRSRQLNRLRRSSRRPTSSRWLVKVQRPDWAVSATPNVSGDGLQHMLGFVDEHLSLPGHAFSAVAGNNTLLLKHDNAPIIQGRSLDALVELLVAVQDAIHAFNDCRCHYGDDYLAACGAGFGLSIDQVFMANYEHMLLRLRAALIEALQRKAREHLLQGGHDKRQRKLLGWFSEFAEKPRPLSTSFPWTIKPSLAVLWGVCWMFYNHGAAMRPTSRAVRVLGQLQWDAPASSDYLNFGRALIGSPSQAQHVHAGPPPRADTATAAHDRDSEHHVFQARNTGTCAPAWSSATSSSRSRLPSLDVAQAGSGANGRPPCTRAVPPPQPGRDTYYTSAALHPSPTALPVGFYPPFHQDLAAAAPPLTACSHLGTDYQNNSWRLATSLPHSSPRHLDTSPQTPSIRVTGAAGSDLFAQPLPSASFGVGIYQPSRQPEAGPHLDNPFYFTDPHFFNMSEQVPNPAPTQTLAPVHIPHKHERTSSITSNSNMPTPVSLAGPRSPLLSPTCAERSRMTASPHIHSRRHSEDRSSMSGDDASLRRISYKRTEDPPRNQDGKFFCKHPDCTGQYFERKCEWSKHMDKHDRPYKCNVKGCEKLQGFTYSGGLLRHEREVHKMHGGTKKSLFCPFHDCKRSSGAGFTRKENLAEHVRRVHRRTSMSADMHGLIIHRETMDASPIPESRVASESPYPRPLEYRDEDDLSLKRKRGSDSGLSDRGNDEMRAEIKRLRHENEEKDSRLRQLEQAVMALQQQGRR
ncbi:hypothetical protein ACN47E_009573 [Coniothyrium glycines]